MGYSLKCHPYSDFLFVSLQFTTAIVKNVSTSCFGFDAGDIANFNHVFHGLLVDASFWQGDVRWTRRTI